MVIQWQQYNRELARRNKLSAHDHYKKGQSGPKRVSFSRNNDFEEAIQQSVINLDSPYVVCGPLAGRPSGKLPMLRKIVKAKMYFLSPVSTSLENLELVQELTFTLMTDFISAYIYDYEETGSCGPFRNLDPNSMFWVETGPRQFNSYGWELSIEFSLSANDLVYNSSKWFS